MLHVRLLATLIAARAAAEAEERADRRRRAAGNVRERDVLQLAGLIGRPMRGALVLLLRAREVDVDDVEVRQSCEERDDQRRDHRQGLHEHAEDPADDEAGDVSGAEASRPRREFRHEVAGWLCFGCGRIRRSRALTTRLWAAGNETAARR